MFGTLQTSFYFGYMIAITYCVMLMYGSISFISSLLFVNYIYENSKLH